MVDMIEKLQKENAILMKLLEQDGLTGLYNRKAIEEKVNHLLSVCQNCGMIVLDIDQFKQVNDELGHLTGDYVLQNVARTLKEGFRFDDFVARVGGDEFVIFFTGFINEEVIAYRMAKMNEQLSKLKLKDGRDCPVQLCYGYSASQKRDTYETLFDRADQVLLEKKRKRRKNAACER